MQQLITFLLFKIKNNGQQQKCSGIKDLQRYVKIFLYLTGYQDIDFIMKIFLKKVEKCCKKMMNKYYLHKYIVVSYYLGYSKH